MWALDLLNDTILMALAPSLLVLLGSMILLGLHWPVLGRGHRGRHGDLCVDDAGVLGELHRAGARVSNAWDTKVGGTLADALTCNAVVKSFGAEAREDARLAGVIGRWRTRVRRTWYRYNYTSTAQLAVLLCFRGSVIGGAILLWIAGRATPGDVTYVLTSYYIIHAYLRDVGMHINNLQRSVNDMEELVAIHGEPIGIADAPDAKPIDIQGGRIVFDDVTFHYGGHRAPLYDGLSVEIRAGERGRPGRPFRLRQDHLRQAGAAALRRQWRKDPDRRSGYRAGDAAFAAQPDRDRAAGADPVSPHAGREHRLWPAERQHGGGRAGGAARQRARLHPASCRRATARWSANAASSCRAASGSASRWRARSWRTRRC